MFEHPKQLQVLLTVYPQLQPRQPWGWRFGHKKIEPSENKVEKTGLRGPQEPKALEGCWNLTWEDVVPILP